MRTGFSTKDMSSVECEVVVVCSAYNQESVIQEALEGFVRQKTSFPFVVLVHDDASTDSTAQIIKSYAERYPRIIKGIYDTENQYQQNKLFWYLEYLRASRAKYLALCEGDDYWIEDDKLEVQYDALEYNPDCSFCFSNAIRVDSLTSKPLGQMLPSYSWEEELLKKGELDTKDLLKITFIPTATFFARKKDWLLEPELPDNAFKGDRAHQLFLSLYGNAYYVNRITSAYRVNNPRSVMGGWRRSDSKMASVLDTYNELYKYFDSYTNFKYHCAVVEAMDTKLFDKMLLTGTKGLVSKKAADQIARERGVSALIKYRLFCISPKLYQIVRKLGRLVKPKSN